MNLGCAAAVQSQAWNDRCFTKAGNDAHFPALGLPGRQRPETLLPNVPKVTTVTVFGFLMNGCRCSHTRPDRATETMPQTAKPTVEKTKCLLAETRPVGHGAAQPLPNHRIVRVPARRSARSGRQSRQARRANIVHRNAWLRQSNQRRLAIPWLPVIQLRRLIPV